MRGSIVYYRLTKLKFECTGCGRCCYGGADDYIGVSTAEAERLRRYLGISRAWFRRRYLLQVEGVGRGIRLLADGRCSFLGADGRCRVYSVRPMQCRTYPFWPELIQTRGAWQNEARRCEGIGRGAGIDRRTVEVQLDRARVAEAAVAEKPQRRRTRS